MLQHPHPKPIQIQESEIFEVSLVGAYQWEGCLAKRVQLPGEGEGYYLGQQLRDALPV